MCSRDKSDYAASQRQQLAGPGLGAHVTGLLLAAMAPAPLQVSLAAAGQAQAQRDQVDRIWRQRLERAGCAADRAIWLLAGSGVTSSAGHFGAAVAR